MERLPERVSVLQARMLIKACQHTVVQFSTLGSERDSTGVNVNDYRSVIEQTHERTAVLDQSRAMISWLVNIKSRWCFAITI